MLTPYEVIVKSALPAIRGLLVRELYTKYGFKQIEIAESLHITQAAVSYYLTYSRGKYIDMLMKHDDILEMIYKLAEDVNNRRLELTELMIRINNIIVVMMKKKYLCDLHKILEPNIDVNNCNLCPEISSHLQT
ncbi:MAG: hypothetical protein DRJ64_04425 [Thermoprotei archaeon]|nr:MAG: hypothetical protein DRJ64_04425 [Thermoprotei archaeon]